MPILGAGYDKRMRPLQSRHHVTPPFSRSDPPRPAPPRSDCADLRRPDAAVGRTSRRRPRGDATRCHRRAARAAVLAVLFRELCLCGIPRGSWRARWRSDPAESHGAADG